MALVDSELIHPTAIIDPEAVVADDVQIGPYAVIEGPVQIGSGCVIEAHACLSGPLVMGRNNVVGHGAVLGKSPQHRGYRDEPTGLSRSATTTYSANSSRFIGERCRETASPLSETATCSWLVPTWATTRRLATAVPWSTARLWPATSAWATSAFSQVIPPFSSVSRVGRLAMLGGLGATSKDIPPFILQQGYNCVTGLNLVGLRRAGFSTESINALRQVFRILYRERRPLSLALARIEADFGTVAEVVEFVTFIRESRTGINPARSQDRESFDIH